MNKTLEMPDYVLLGDTTIMIDALAEDMPCVPFNLHRRWEYGMALRFLQGKGVKTIVDAGGAGSLFAPLAAVYGYEVMVVDPAVRVTMADIQGAVLEKPIRSVQAEFSQEHRADAVVALSVLEHLTDDLVFVDEMCSAARNAVFLTVDFSSDGGIYAADQKRTYTKAGMTEIAEVIRRAGFTVETGQYDRCGPFLKGAYTFASLGGFR